MNLEGTLNVNQALFGSNYSLVGGRVCMPVDKYYLICLKVVENRAGEAVWAY